MRFLQIGLGSMGKRRIRNLFALGYKNITGFDLREDRRKETEEEYKIQTVNKLTDSLISKSDVFIISTPPDKHLEYMRLAVNKKKSAFVEASVIRDGLIGLAQEAEKRKILIIPSATFKFHPSIKLIKDIVKSGRYGKACNFLYHMGQFLPDWHPWEDIRDFYVGKKETSGCREMVSFEMTWLVDIFGFPKEIFAFFGKTLSLGVDINDSYSINLKFNGYLGNILIDVVARFADRHFILNLEKASLFWDWNEKSVNIYDAISKRWFSYFEPQGKAHEGYNRNLIEEMYVEELSVFIGAIKGTMKFPNSLRDDIKVLGILESLEKTNKGLKL